MKTMVVIGAGPMGLAAAHRAVQLGHSVDLVEGGPVAGGTAAHFDFGGLSVERFYHFVCKADQSTFALMRELGIGDRMRWRPTSMGYYCGGALHPWGDPLSLLRFPGLGLVDKLRYGAQMFLATRRTRWDDLDRLTARQWIEAGAGPRVYRALWDRLMRLKFFELSDDVSAAWIWTRIKRVGTSRRSLFQEELGYIEGGSQTLVDALTRAIEAGGGRVHLSCPAERVLARDGRVTGVRAGGRDFPADAVVCTVPTPYVPALAPDLPEPTRARYAAIRNIGVACVLLKLRRSVSPHFWVNIVDDGIDIPGIIEFSRLRPMDATLVYVPYYMPATHPKWGWSDARLIDESFGYLKRLNPALAREDLVDATVGRLKHAQPICEPRFLGKLPPVATPIAGLQVADTSYYYPEDRGISESVRFGRTMAEAA